MLIVGLLLCLFAHGKYFLIINDSLPLVSCFFQGRRMMATLIPTLNSCLARMTSGEKRFARLLEAKLEEDYLCWYDVAIGNKTLHPDYIIFHPCRGLLVLEVKDWKIGTLIALDKDHAKLLTDKGECSVKNPLEQARDYSHAIVKLLERDPQLVFSGGPRKGKLMQPYAIGVVLTNITRKQFNEGQLAEAIPEHLVICRDEMVESVDAEAFQQRLWAMFQYKMRGLITLPQIDRIRWHIFPEIRLPEQRDLFAEETNNLTAELPDILKIMDIQQEQLARSLGEGHRIIHGVAGSGKTMILGYRAEYLAAVVKRPILILCFNRKLAETLEQNMLKKGLHEKVNTMNFHEWCRRQLTTYNISIPKQKDQTSAEKEKFHAACVQQVIEHVDRKLIPSGQYDAILIDEGHDFKDEWYKLIVQMINPETNALLVLYDDAQSIYQKKKKIVFSQLGIQARGRTTILKLNYRNTVEILTVAKAFAEELLHAESRDEDQPPTIEPIGAGNHGSLPLLIKLPKLYQECERIADILIEHNQAGMPWQEMGIIYRWNYMAEQITKSCQKRGIPIKEKKDQIGINLMTMHASKGLEYPLVCIPAVGLPAKYEGSPEDEARLLYVAMTRATKHLVMTHGENSHFAEKLNTAIAATSNYI